MEFDTALAQFVSATQAKINAYFAKNYQHVSPPTLSTTVGPQYVRVVSTQPGSRSVFCFVRKSDGAVLKAAGWKAPAKHSRGSIYINAGQDAVGVYGANYL